MPSVWGIELAKRAVARKFAGTPANEMPGWHSVLPHFFPNAELLTVVADGVNEILGVG